MNTECAIEPLAVEERSLRTGAALVLPSGYPASLSQALAQSARAYPRHGVTCLDADGRGQEQSYAELVTEAARVLAGLRRLGLKPGDCVLFQLDQNPEFIAGFWACVLGGFVPVPISISPTYEQHHNTLAKLRNAWAMLGEPLTLAGSALAPRLQGFAEREGLAHFRVAALADLRRHEPAMDWHPSQPDDLALLLLTSGSTGLPKAVRHTHRTLLSWVASVASFCEFTPADVSINWMPLDHVGGIVMFHLRDAVIGCRQVQAMTEPVLQRPLAWLEWIERYRATITWAPNFAFGLINEQEEDLAQRRFDLSSMRFILNAGEAIVSRTTRRFLSLLAPHGLPATAMRPAWGMSETSSAVTFSQRFTLAGTSDQTAFVEVGEPILGTDIRLVDQNDVPVAQGKVGRLQIRGASITPGYHQNPEANQKSYTADGWFITGDLGVMKDGQLAITGREKDIIIINGVNFYSHEIESVVEELDGVEVSFTAACAIRQPGENTDRVAVFFSPREDARLRLPELIKKIRSTVVEKEGVSPDYVVPVAKDQIPKTAIGKIQRAQLKQQFERGEFASVLAGLAQTGSSGKTPDGPGSWFYRRVWREAPLSGRGVVPEGRWVVFADDLGAGQALVQTLRGKKRDCALVVAGRRFLRKSADEFVIDPRAEEDLQQLWQALRADGKVPRETVYLRTYDAPAEFTAAAAFEAAQDALLSGLLAFTKFLARGQSETESHRLWLVSCGAQAVLPTDRVALEKGTLTGWLKTLPQEIAGLDCVHVDLDESETGEVVSHLCSEFAAEEKRPEIAYRAGRRFEARLFRVEMPSTPPASALVDGGCYLLTGGVGGIGREVARYLLEQNRARLLIVGRSSAEAVEDRLEPLRRLGGEIIYASADVAHPEALASAVAEAEKQWGRALDGIFHLAGRLEIRALAEENSPSLARSLRPKTAGGWAVHQVAKNRPGLLVVNFSSLLGYFGGYQYGAYAMANAFLEGLSHQQRRAGLRSHCLLWSSWDNTGMNQAGAAEEAATRAKGYLPIPPAQGIDSLKMALACEHPDLLIGLNGTNGNIRPHLDGVSVDSADDEADCVEPRTETERKLVKIWQELLKRPRVGIRDNFFEIGGRSLLAAKIFAQVEKVFGRSLPLATLFKAPTIEQLAPMIEGAVGSAAPICQVEPLQSAGKRPPFFCIPGGASDVIVFRPLAAQLGSDQPFYGLQAHGLDGTKTDAPIVPITELAGHFIREIKAIQPRGPYHLGGHCFGALLAYEIARQLQAGGESVATLALLDPTATTTLDIGAFHALRSRLLFLLRIYLRLSLWEKIKFPVTLVSYFFSRKVVVSHRLQHTIERLRIMHEGYALQPYAGKVSLYLAADSRHDFDGPRDVRLVLGKLAQGGAQVHRVGGNHHTMLQEPDVADLAQKLSADLQAPASA
jgi:acyl-CoA synthetase (AMP-forming)/AMP-acid ligase II/thioesterase domain-containing protein/NAD(P)-dependent dehydrogenase (short-subunit alcohol dehydrogenase family)